MTDFLYNCRLKNDTLKHLRKLDGYLCDYTNIKLDNHQGKLHIVYLTRRYHNNKPVRFYIGKHSTDNLNDGYLGSGKLLKKAIWKYGKEDFKRTVIAIFTNEQSAYDLEKNLVTSETIKLNECYNIIEGGGNVVGYYKNKVHLEHIDSGVNSWFPIDSFENLHSSRYKPVSPNMVTMYHIPTGKPVQVRKNSYSAIYDIEYDDYVDSTPTVPKKRLLGMVIMKNTKTKNVTQFHKDSPVYQTWKEDFNPWQPLNYNRKKILDRFLLTFSYHDPVLSEGELDEKLTQYDYYTFKQSHLKIPIAKCDEKFALELGLKKCSSNDGNYQKYEHVINQGISKDDYPTFIKTIFSNGGADQAIILKTEMSELVTCCIEWFKYFTKNKQ